MTALVSLALFFATADVSAIAGIEGRLSLTPAQQKKVHDLVAETSARAQKARAEQDLAELELARLLEQDAPDEKKVARLLDRVSAIAGERRKIDTLGWLRVRAQLDAKQRRELEALRTATPAPVAVAPAPIAAPIASAAPPANTGLLNVSCTPPARILVDGADTGRTTPARLDLVAGKHTVTLQTADQRVDSVVDITPGGTVSISRQLANSSSSKTAGN